MYKELTLLKFLTDLDMLQQNGLSDDQCTEVKAALSQAITLASHVKSNSRSRFFKIAFYEELQKFATKYDKWNHHKEGKDVPPSAGQENRMQYHNEMKKQRQALWEQSFKMWSNKLETAEKDAELDAMAGLDKEISKEMHETFRDVVEKYPDVFPKLKRQIDQLKDKNK